MSPHLGLVNSDRTDVSREASQHAASISATARRIDSVLGRTGTTSSGLRQVKEDLARLAEEALELRRLL